MSLILKKQPFKVNTSKLNSIINTSTMKSNKNKSLIDSTGMSIFQLSQNQIHFLNTELNEIYEVSMFVRNVSQKKQEIRLKKPKSSCLTVSLVKQGLIAPGLDVKIIVTYDSKDNQRIQDFFTIISDNYECDIPVHIIPEAGKIQFEPFVNFGFIKVGNSKEINWKISNKCQSLTYVQLHPSVKGNCEFKIQPKTFSLEPKAERQVKLTITSHQVGHIEGVIDVQPKLFSVSSIDFVANFCQYTRFISDDEGNHLSQILMDPLFSGQFSENTVNLVNNTPKSCQFRISRKKGCPTEDQNNLITPQQFGKDDSQKLIYFNPSQGVLEPYESIQLLTKVQANFSQLDQQNFCNYILGRVSNLNDQKQFSYTVKVHINEQDNPLTLYLKGNSIIPKLALSSTFLDFGQIPVNSKKQKQFKIENFSSKSITLNFKNSSNYKFSDKSVKINSKGSCYMTLVFCPKIVGQLNQVLPMVAGQFSFPIKALGKGTFNNKKKKSVQQNYQIDTADNGAKCEQIKVEDLDKTFLQNQISYINSRQSNNRKQTSFLEETNKTTVHFETSYVGSVNQSFNGNSIYLTQHKKSKTLRDRNGKQVKITDSSSFNPNDETLPYPSLPKNQQQQRTINKQLTSLQLTNIEVGPVILDIGKIYLRSIIKKTFHVCNFNSKAISIQLNTNNYQCFSESSEQKQILSGNSWGGLQIKFEALKQGEFKHNLQYIINGKHFFEMMITGTVIQPTINLSRNQIKFFATEEDKTFEKKQTILFTNPYEYQVQFSIIKNSQNSLFKFQPENGKISPNGTKNITVFHRFDLVSQYGVKIEQITKVKIIHGKSLEIKCISLVPQCNCISKSQQINFKEVAIGKSYENKVILKNSSKNFTIYKIIIPKEIENIISTSVLNGYLHAEQMQEIVFKIQAFSSMTIDSALTFLIRGGKSISLPIKASIITPKIRVQNQKVDFGSTPIEGNPAIKIISLINDSQIPVDLEFRLPYDSFLSQSFKVSKILDENSQLISSTQANKSSTFKSYVIRINPKSRSNIVVEFTPGDVTLYEFLLPLYVFNSNQSISDLQKPCTCKGIKNRLMATEKQINFGKIIIQQNLESYQKNKSLQIKNPQQQPIEWWIDDSNIYPFSLQKSRGKLQGFEKINLKVFFFSDIEGDYTKDFQFFIDHPQNNENIQSKQEQSNQEYLKITVKSSACYPTLYFDQPYVILPVVGLNQESKTTFEIINGGYENINIKHLICQQFSNVDLKINFLDGTNLGVTKKKIKIEVSFKSQKPISFTVKINFYDTNNRSFSIPVSGTADNCIYTMIPDERMGNNWIQQIQRDCSFLKHYINSIGCLEDSIYQFPKSLMENDFDKFNQLLSHFSSSFQKIKPNLKKNDKNKKYFFSFDFLSEVIKIIKSQGGFLNQIRPEMLLSTHQNYLQAIRYRSEGNINILTNYMTIEQNNFQIQQKKAWIVLAYQIFKVFSRVSVGKTKTNQFWVKFSARQKLIVNWLQQAYLSQAKAEYQKKRNVLQQLNDSQLLSAVISKYTNIKVLEVYGRQIKGIKQKQRRIKNIIDTFTQIGINCHCRVEDILRSNPRQMLLIIEGLYSILPSYLQKGQPVIFACALGQTLTKSIQISNPSKHQITYVAKIQASNKAYVIQNQQQFVIESKSSHEVKVKYISNVNLNNLSGTLTLTGKASSKFTPSTFIFVLKSQNLGRVSQKNIQVTGQLYEQCEFGINVQNHFEAEGEFKVDLVNANTNKECPLAFYCVNPLVKIRKGQVVNFNLLFIPLTTETNKCLVVFKDPKVGQFQYQITGVVEQPQMSLDVLKIPNTLLTNKKYLISLPIPVRNDNLNKAKKIIESIIERTQKKTAKTQQNLSLAQKYYPKVNTGEAYNVKILSSNQMVQLRSDSIFIKQIQSTTTQTNEQQNNKQEPKVSLEINMKMAVKEASFVLLIRNSSGTDIRRYKVILNSSYKPLRYELQLKTSINKTLIQKLPLINVNNEASSFYITMQTNQISKTIFNLEKQKEVIVPGKSTQNISLNFKPKAQTNYNAVVKIQNISSGQIVEYEILGVGEEPESEILSFEQQIRKQKIHQIKLPVQRTSKFTVSKFTLQDAIYQKNFILNNSNNNSFKFKYTAKIPGTYEGKLVIQDDSKVYAYKISINARDVIEQEIKIKTIQRKTFKGQIQNIPLGNYSVSCTNPCLKFAKNYISNEKNKGLFKFEHYSTKPQEIQSLIIFQNDKVGQLSILLKIKVQQMPEFKFQPFKTELGSKHQESIRFQNQQDHPLKITGSSSHPKIFSFQPLTIMVPPKSQFTAKLIYLPSKLELEQGKINFVSQRGQKWNYHISGYGLLQSKPAVIQMSSTVGRQKIESISFVNPLQKRLQATVQLHSLSEEQNLDKNLNNSIEAFQLILKTNKFQLDYQQQLLIPILIKSNTVKVNRSMLTITLSQKVVFKYQLVGISEFVFNEQKFFRLQTRTKKEDTLTFQLPFTQKQQISLLSKAELQITTQNQNMRQIVKDSIKIVSKEKTLVQGNKVSFDIVLKAFKPFRAQTFFTIKLPNQCQWVQKIDVNFTIPPADDKIQIISQMNKSTSVKFKLSNRIKHHSKFKAYFAAPSSNELTVFPKNGQLQPLGREASSFQITFLPSVYKKQWQGKLIIETEQSFWSYQIKGILPPYLPPIAKSLINNSSTKKLSGDGERTRIFKKSN